MGERDDVLVAEDFELRVGKIFAQQPDRRQREDEIADGPAADDENARLHGQESGDENPREPLGSRLLRAWHHATHRPLPSHFSGRFHGMVLTRLGSSGLSLAQDGSRTAAPQRQHESRECAPCRNMHSARAAAELRASAPASGAGFGGCVAGDAAFEDHGIARLHGDAAAHAAGDDVGDRSGRLDRGDAQAGDRLVAAHHEQRRIDDDPLLVADAEDDKIPAWIDREDAALQARAHRTGLPQLVPLLPTAESLASVSFIRSLSALADLLGFRQFRLRLRNCP